MFKILLFFVLFSLSNCVEQSKTCQICLKLLEQRGGSSSLENYLLAECEELKKSGHGNRFEECKENARRMRAKTEQFLSSEPTNFFGACKIAKMC
ncbi:unnamed protein product [Caenorhabditis angaria]|uniref:Saposin B-type domain-containing protein n=1 Tax=Caenorhabditis angaria TaxID=860376 RepID=A0A9P1MTW0_9PELO|nr:unnamed protein product [Caenorhabditis angaria]